MASRPDHVPHHRYRIGVDRRAWPISVRPLYAVLSDKQRRSDLGRTQLPGEAGRFDHLASAYGTVANETPLIPMAGLEVDQMSAK